MPEVAQALTHLVTRPIHCMPPKQRMPPTYLMPHTMCAQAYAGYPGVTPGAAGGYGAAGTPGPSGLAANTHQSGTNQQVIPRICRTEHTGSCEHMYV
jgi:hypothetical protein